MSKAARSDSKGLERASFFWFIVIGCFVSTIGAASQNARGQ